MAKNRCPIFNKYIVCASGFPPDTKEEIKKLVQREGGQYQGDLLCGTTTHLVINEPKGDKYNFAKLWKMNIVNSNWIYDSIEAKYCLPEKQYHLDAPSASTSTPTNINKSTSKATKGTKLDIDISMIANMTTRNVVNETEVMRMSCSSTMNNQDNTTVFHQAAHLSKHADVLKELNSIGKIKSTLFDGFGVSSIGDTPLLKNNYLFFF